MQLFDELNEDNFVLFASRYYDNPQCMSVEEFHHDLNRFKYLKRLLRRYTQNDDLQERLILNHIVVLYNVFSIAPANKMMFYRMEKEYWSAIKTFLIFLNYLRDDELVDVPLDQTIVERLRNL
jgi:hypothetical protein